MSHWTVAKVRIKNPNIQILRQALEVIAKELGVNQIAENFEVIGWGARRRKCQLAIPMRLPYGNGYGVYIDAEGNVNVVVDDHGAPLTAQQFANKLAQYYTALAVVTAAQQLGFSVNVQQLPQGVLIDLAR